MRALSDEVEVKLKEAGTAPLRVDGFQSDSWRVIDYGSVIVHVFSKEARDHFDLEHLWADGENVPLPFAGA